MERNNNYFILYANCIPVKGVNKSLIYDLQYGRALKIPNLLYEILTIHKAKKINEIKGYYNNIYNKGLEKYFNFLVKQRFGFYYDNINLFPNLDLNWEYPGEITNCIIDINNERNLNFKNIIKQLDNLNCEALQLRFHSFTSVDKLKEILNYTLLSRLKSIEIIAPFSKEYNKINIKKLCDIHKRIHYILLYSSSRNRTIFLDNKVFINYLKKTLNLVENCGNISNIFKITYSKQ